MTPDDSMEELLGASDLQRLIAVFGGTVVTFAKTPTGIFFGELVRVLGPGPADKLWRKYAGEQIYIPINADDERMQRNVEIAARVAAGESTTSVARSYRVVVRMSERHVRRIVAGMSKINVVPRKLTDK